MALLHELKTKTDEDLLRMTEGMQRDNATAVFIERILQARNWERQAAGAMAFTHAARRLTLATWGLAAVTAVLIVATFFQVSRICPSAG
jgi:hypothetical protein